MKERNAGTYIILFFLIVPAMFSLFFIHLKMNEIVSHQKRKGNRWAFFCSFIWAHLLFPFSLLAHNLMPDGSNQRKDEMKVNAFANAFHFFSFDWSSRQAFHHGVHLHISCVHWPGYYKWRKRKLPGGHKEREDAVMVFLF